MAVDCACVGLCTTTHIRVGTNVDYTRTHSNSLNQTRFELRPEHMVFQESRDVQLVLSMSIMFKECWPNKD